MLLAGLPVGTQSEPCSTCMCVCNLTGLHVLPHATKHDRVKAHMLKRGEDISLWPPDAKPWLSERFFTLAFAFHLFHRSSWNGFTITWASYRTTRIKWPFIEQYTCYIIYKVIRTQKSAFGSNPVRASAQKWCCRITSREQFSLNILIMRRHFERMVQSTATGNVYHVITILKADKIKWLQFLQNIQLKFLNWSC